jgi:hypothetical protein
MSFPNTPEFFNRIHKDKLALTSKCKKCKKTEVEEWRKNNREKVNKQSNNWNKNNKEKVAKSRQKTLNNPASRELKKLRQSRYYQSHKEREAARVKKWAEDNKEKLKLQRKNRYQNNKERALSHVHKRRARKFGNGTEPYTRTEMLEVYGSDCYLCGLPIDLSVSGKIGSVGWENGLHIEHVISLASGGPDMLENVRPSHGKCNLNKGTK